MKTVLLISMAICIAFGFVIAIAKAKKRSNEMPEKWPYSPKAVMSEPEQTLYYRLKEALPECEILAQVSLDRILECPKGKERMRWLLKINQKSVDFAVCLKNFTTVAIIELDDSSHNSKNRQKADADKEKAITDAGLPIIRWHVKDIPNTAEIRRVIAH